MPPRWIRSSSRMRQHQQEKGQPGSTEDLGGQGVRTFAQLTPGPRGLPWHRHVQLFGGVANQVSMVKAVLQTVKTCLGQKGDSTNLCSSRLHRGVTGVRWLDMKKHEKPNYWSRLVAPSSEEEAIATQSTLFAHASAGSDAFSFEFFINRPSLG